MDDVKREMDHEYISRLITQELSQKLFREVSDFMMKKSQEDIYADEVLSDNPDGEEEEIYED